MTPPIPTGDSGPPLPDRDALLAEAAALAGSVQQQVLLLLGAGAFMLVMLSVSDQTLVSGREEVTIPVIDVPTTLSSLVVFGPVVILGLLGYTHVLLGRLKELERAGIYPPQTYFFTIRSLPARIVADCCFYIYVPLLSGWFFLRTIFRPESSFLLGVFILTSAMCAIAWARRSHLGPPVRRWIALSYAVVATAVILGSAGVFAVSGRAPFQAVAAHVVELDLEDANLSGLADDVKLSGFNFDGQCLRNANLSGLELSGASFVDADLSGAILDGTRLRNVDFRGANLAGASIAGADLQSARLTYANLARTNAENAAFDDADLVGVSLDRAKLTGASLVRVDATDAGFRRADMEGARFSGAQLACADLREVSAKRALFQNVLGARSAWFADATLVAANFTASKLDGADFTRSDLRGARLGGATLVDTVFDRALTEGANLADAKALSLWEGRAPVRACPLAVAPKSEAWRDACS